jgi:hypothetical protein
MGKVIKKVAGVAGAAIGFATGGPAGAVKGYQVGSSVGSLFGGGGGGGGTQQGNTANGAYFDYFAESRPQYGSRLNTLMGYGGTPGTLAISKKNTPLSYSEWSRLPENAVNNQSNNRLGTGNFFSSLNGYRSSKTAYNDYVKNIGSTITQEGTPGISGTQASINEVLNSPGYMGGMREGQRTLAAGLARTGQVGSGAEQIAYGNLGQDYFRKSYQDLFNQYASLSGATQQPLNMASANEIGYNQNRLNDQATGQALGAIGSIFNSSSNTPSVNYTPSGYSNSGGYAPGATDYTPTNTNFGMGGVSGPANMGGGIIGPNWGSV